MGEYSITLIFHNFVLTSVISHICYSLGKKLILLRLMTFFCHCLKTYVPSPPSQSVAKHGKQDLMTFSYNPYINAPSLTIQL